MSADRWTFEEHPAPWDAEVTAWHAVAPANRPHETRPHLAFGHTLPDGRTAYPFTGIYAAMDAADAANEKATP